MEPSFNTPNKPTLSLLYSSPSSQRGPQQSLDHALLAYQSGGVMPPPSMMTATHTATNAHHHHHARVCSGSPNFSPPTPAPSSSTTLPASSISDRYITARASQDNSLSHYLLTSKENMTPLMLMSRQTATQQQQEQLLRAQHLPYTSPPRDESLPSTMSARMGSPPPTAPFLGSQSPFSSTVRRVVGGGTGSAMRRSSPSLSVNAPHPPAVSSPTSRVTEVFAKLRFDSASIERRGSSASPLGPHNGSPYSPSLPLFTTGSPSTNAVVEVEPYACKLARALFSDAPQTSVLGLHAAESAAPREEDKFSSSLGVVFENNRARNFQSKAFRVIAQTPERILDAADMEDDFYLNLLDWSSTGVLSVALQSVVYLWDARTSNITQLPPANDNEELSAHSSQLVCSINWHPNGQHLAVGQQDGAVALWDVETKQVVRQWRQHTQRVGSLAWSGGSILASGGRDALIHLNDLREATTMTHAGHSPGPTSSSYNDEGGSVAVLKSHEQEVCGLKWAVDGVLLASGSNDNMVLVWDRRMVSAVTSGSSFSSSPQLRATRPLLYLNGHTSAVKALAWNPAQPSLLATGGGADDKTLRFWNTATGECLHTLNTTSQVCGVLWDSTGTELVSSHGYAQNQLTLWKYPSLRRVAELTGHTDRVLHMCKSPDGEVVASAAGDETIRFWRCFPPREPPTAETGSLSELSPSRFYSLPASPPPLPRYHCPLGRSVAPSRHTEAAGGRGHSYVDPTRHMAMMTAGGAALR